MTFIEWYNNQKYVAWDACQAAWEASAVNQPKQMVDLALENSQLAEELEEAKTVLKFWRDEVDTPESAQLFEIMVRGLLKDD